jgi:hypothetical protein
MATWIRKQDPMICCLQDNTEKTKHLLKVKGWKKISNKWTLKTGISHI